MKDLPVPKFKIGDNVYYSSCSYESKYVQCPDCLGKKIWNVSTPAGEKFEINCSTCQFGFESSTGGISVFDFCPRVSVLTIGSVRIDTNEAAPISYMCEETGVGSGAIYYESLLFLSKSEAEEMAKKLTHEMKETKNKEESDALDKKKKRSRRKPKIVVASL